MTSTRTDLLIAVVRTQERGRKIASALLPLFENLDPRDLKWMLGRLERAAAAIANLDEGLTKKTQGPVSKTKAKTKRGPVRKKKTMTKKKRKRGPVRKKKVCR